jgi:hypothetical protein
LADQADKLKRLLALALNESAADGEAMNALRAARKIAKELGGVDKCLKITEMHSGQYYNSQGTYWNPFGDSPFNEGPLKAWQEMVRRKQQEEQQAAKRRDEMRREKEAQAARQREEAKARNERLKKEAEQTMNGQRTNIYDGMFNDEQKDAIRQMIIEMLGGKV